MSQEAIQSIKRKGAVTREGVVVSDKMNKTRIVEVTRSMQHPVFKRVVRRKMKYSVHDETNQAKTGDKVQIVQTKPISKNKCWKLVKVISQ